MVTKKDAYEEIVFVLEEVDSKWLYSEIRKWFAPVKVKLLCWLVLENKIITRENIVKRGGMGLGTCILCNEAEESVFHLIASCPFTKHVWEDIRKAYNFKFLWNLDLVEQCFKQWIKKVFY